MYIDLLILDQISQSPSHGYEIKKNIQQRLNIIVDMNNNMLYPALQRFEKQGAVIKEVEQQVGKPDRNIYRITDKGEILLRQLILNYDQKHIKSQIEFMIRVYLFDRLTLDERLHILQLRRNFVAEIHKYVQHNQSLTDRPFFAQEVSGFGSELLASELAWIDRLMEHVQQNI